MSEEQLLFLQALSMAIYQVIDHGLSVNRAEKDIEDFFRVFARDFNDYASSQSFRCRFKLVNVQGGDAP